jgi:hypothetical protein
MRPFRAARLRPSYSGYSASSASKEQELERQFDEQLNTADLKAWLKQLSSAPNQVGSPHDKANAEFIFSKFKEWGWDAHIETFEVLYPTPKKESLQLIAPHAYTAVLREPPIRGDSTSSQTKGVLPPYAAYGADDNVTADLVYVNYGMPDDYDDLKRLGIDVKGKIVIARYGDGWRGLKPRLAQEHGAVGCIIYSDPWDDGYREGDVYPRGGFRPEFGVQRGSVADMTLYPGDPINARSRSDQRCTTTFPRERENPYADSGDTDFLRGCETFSGSAGGADSTASLERKLADHLSRWPWKSAGAPRSSLRLESKNDL